MKKSIFNFTNHLNTYNRSFQQGGFWNKSKKHWRSIAVDAVLFVFLILYSINLSAQQQLIITDETIKHRDQQRACVKVKMEPETKMVKKELKDWLKDHHDVKLKGIGFLTNKEVLSAEEVKIEGISDKDMNLYAKIVEIDDYTEMSVFGSYGYDIYITPEKYPVAYQKMEGIVNDFLGDFVPNYYQNRIRLAESKLSDLEKRQKHLQGNISDNKGDIKKMYKEIEDLKKENEQLSGEVANNRLNMQEAATTVALRKQKLLQVKDLLKEDPKN